MAIKRIPTTYYSCDLESERDLSWTNVQIYTAENGGNWWTVVDGAFVNNIPLAIIPPTGTPSSSTYMRGDNSWTAIAGGGDMLKSENLSGLANYTTARANLGLGTLATQSATITDYLLSATASSTYATITNLALKAPLISPAFTTPTLGAALATSINGLTITSTTGILTITAGKTLTTLKTISLTAADDTGVYTLPTGTKTLLATDGNGSALTGLTASQVGLGNVTNESKATMFASPTFTGTVTIPAAQITLAMMSNMATASVIYRKTAGTGVPEVNTLATLKTDLVLVKADVGLGNVVNSDTTTTANITDSSNKRFITDAQQTVLGNTSGTNSGNETTSTLGATINGSSAAVPNNTDLVATVDTSVVKKITWTNVKAFLKTYFDTLYQVILVSGTNIKTINGSTVLGSGDLVVSGATSATETEIDFGTTPVSEALFTITDAAITATKKIMCTVSYSAPTGKDQDELEMDDLQLRAVAGTGNFALYVRAADGSYLADKFKIYYIIAA